MKLLSYDGPVIRFLERIADLMILNFLTLVCSIPVITAGAAITAHYKVSQDLLHDYACPVLKTYFRAFAENFKQATVFWLIDLLIIALYLVDIFVIEVYFDEGWAKMTYFVLTILGAVSCGVMCYIFALIPRFENTVKEHLRNGFILAIAQLPRTVLMVLLAAIPLLLAKLSIEVFLNTLIIWFFFGISLILYLQSLLMHPVIVKLEEASADADTQPEA